MISEFSDEFRNLLTLKENALRNTRVLDLFLGYEKGLIGEIVIDEYRPYSIVF